MAFGVWDYLVFSVSLLISALIGVYSRFSGGKQKTADEYLLANRSMPVIPVTFSLMASFISSITLLGVSNEIYQFGTQFVIINVSYGLATFFVAYLYIPVFYKLNATSAYEYLEKRFGRAARLSASISYSLQMILYMGIVLYAPALALEALTGLNKNISIVIVGGVCTFYSTIGGLKAVLLTDLFQSLLMYAAVMAIIISGIVYAGGVSEIFKAADEGGRLELWNFNPDPTIRHTWFTLTIGNIFTFLSLYAVNQAQVQRFLSVKTLKNAQLAAWLNWPCLSFLSLSCAFSGLVLYYYYKTCDPFAQRRIESRDQNMPLYVSDALGHLSGVSGLFVAGIFSGALSSVSSTVNSLAAVTLEDYVKPLYKRRTGKEWSSTSAKWSKIFALVYGIIIIAGAFLAQFLGGILQASLTLFGAVGGPLLGLFTVGMTTEVTSELAAVPALFISIIFSCWMGFSPKPLSDRQLTFSTDDCSKFGGLNESLSNVTPVEDGKEYLYLMRISYMYTGAIGFLITYISAILLSYFLKLIKHHRNDNMYLDKAKTLVNPDLFLPPIAKMIRKRNDKISKSLADDNDSKKFEENKY